MLTLIPHPNNDSSDVLTEAQVCSQTNAIFLVVAMCILKSWVWFWLHSSLQENETVSDPILCSLLFSLWENCLLACFSGPSNENELFWHMHYATVMVGTATIGKWRSPPNICCKSFLCSHHGAARVCSFMKLNSHCHSFCCCHAVVGCCNMLSWWFPPHGFSLFLALFAVELLWEWICYQHAKVSVTQSLSHLHTQPLTHSPLFGSNDQWCDSRRIKRWKILQMSWVATTTHCWLAFLFFQHLAALGFPAECFTTFAGLWCSSDVACNHNHLYH